MKFGKKPFRVYVGYDPVDDNAFRVCEQSLRAHATIPVEVIKVWDRPLRQAEIYWRSYRVSGGLDGGERNGQMYDVLDGKPFSTAFAFARFAVPILEDYQDNLVLFMDSDMMWRADIADLLDDTWTGKAVWCVQHLHEPADETKIYGCVQTRYRRKNWSSFMLMNPAKCRSMTPFKLNQWEGGQLHAFEWLEDGEIGALHERWNWLEGWSTSDEPKCVHYTRGTPDMPGHEDVPFATEWWGHYRDSLNEETKRRSVEIARNLAELGRRRAAAV